MGKSSILVIHFLMQEHRKLIIKAVLFFYDFSTFLSTSAVRFVL